jgi:hypothetical protein
MQYKDGCDVMVVGEWADTRVIWAVPGVWVWGCRCLSGRLGRA